MAPVAGSGIALGALMLSGPTAASTDMKAGERSRTIVVLWLVVAAVCTLATVGGMRALQCYERAVGGRGSTASQLDALLVILAGSRTAYALPPVSVSWTVTLEIAGWVVVVAAHPAL